MPLETSRICACCRKEFSGLANKKYCSQACVRKVRTENERNRRTEGCLVTRECPVCKVKFVRDNGAKYCSPRCTKTASRVSANAQSPSTLRTCDKCREPFISAKEQARCFFCRQGDAHLVTTKDTRVSMPSGGKQLACNRCEHWIPTEGAELGYSCNINFWMRCQPYNPKAKPWSPKVIGAAIPKEGLGA